VSAGKRLLDLGLASLGLVLLTPVLLGLAAAIRLDSAGPAFFRQVRVGRQGKPFRLWKLRTMVANAEALGGPLTIGRDPRITRVGRWLRQTKLDELPQLLNVVRGEMSLVGPRPEVPELVRLYEAWQRPVLDLMPGITDPASLTYADESGLLAASADPTAAYLQEVMPTKVRLNLDYAATASLGTDLEVIRRTLGHVLGQILAAGSRPRSS
jgi:lipopolysaccharide/colanic/teichoic acid biosynthesis glycosyltransferase